MTTSDTALTQLFGPTWQPYQATTALSGWEAPWLQHTGSLTAALQQVCQHRLTVQVLEHHFISAPEAALPDLELAPAALLLHREVLLCDGTIPLVFACSLLPEAALHGRYEELRELGSRPLGHWIFAEPVLQRAVLQHARLPATASLFQRLPASLRTTETLLGRKTLFSGAAKPLLVSEFFLPTLAFY